MLLDSILRKLLKVGLRFLVAYVVSYVAITIVLVWIIASGPVDEAAAATWNYMRSMFNPGSGEWTDAAILIAFVTAALYTCWWAVVTASRRKPSPSGWV